MVSISKNISNKKIIKKGIETLLDEIEKTIALERDYAISSQGEALAKLTYQKRQLLVQLKNLLNSNYILTEDIKKRLKRIHEENKINFKLLKSILGLIKGYKKILKDIPICNGTYTKSGNLNSQAVSMRFCGSA